MAGWDNDIAYAKNADFTGSATVTESNGLIADKQIWVGSTVANAGGTHVNVLTLTAGTGVTLTQASTTLTVGLTGGTSAIEKITVDASTAPGTNPVVPSGSGTIIIEAAAVAAHSVPIETRSRAVNSLKVEIQEAAAVAATDATKSGIAHFDSAAFDVDANGFVQLNGGAVAIQQISGDSGSISGNNVTIYANNAAVNSGSSVKFVNSGTISTFNVTDANSNTLIGTSSGNLTLTGINNTAVGKSTLTAVTSGGGNTCIGYQCGTATTTGGNNTFAGYQSGNGLTTGGNNTSIGVEAMLVNNNNDSVAIGYQALANSTGDSNVVIGSQAAITAGTSRANTFVGKFSAKVCTNAAQCSALGVESLLLLTTGNNNTALGAFSLNAITTGEYNTAIGYNSGVNATVASSSNIYLGNNGAAESNTIRIGIQGAGSAQQNTCFIAGIVGVTTANTQLVTINSSTGQLGVVNATGFTWTDVTGGTQTIAVENGYLTDNAGGVTYTLPATAAIGDTFKIVGKLGLATITPNANQQLLVGSVSGAVGATGTAVATNVGDCIEFVCTTSGASTKWRAANFVGNWTVTT